MSGIDYGSESSFKAPVMRIDDEGHGFVGVVYEAETRQATDFDTGALKWFVDRKLVKSDSKPSDAAQPVPEYVFHIAVEKGKGAFTRRDEDGNTIKLSSGKAALDVRTVEEEDIAVVTGAAWFSKAVKGVKLNVGHRVKFKRLTPARDEAGDRMTDVRCEIEILGTVDSPAPYKPLTSVAASDPIYGDEEDGW
jgi:hypothetical protein